MARVNYLNNKDILAEIHKSKSSYCYYTEKKYGFFDLIVNDLSEVTEEAIQECKVNRVKKIIAQDRQEQKDNGVKVNKIVNKEIEPEDILTEDLVYRCMTYDHIPDHEGRVKTPKKTADYKVRLFFYPFKHYILKDGNFIEVGRSHWKGNLEDGEFCQEHGKTTDKLGNMYMELTRKFAKKGNWRNYCIDEESEILTSDGWTTINDISTNQKVMSYDIKEDRLVWSNIKSIFKDDFKGQMIKMQSENFDALVTPGHKWATDRGLVKVDHLSSDDKIIVMSGYNENNKAIFEDKLIKFFIDYILFGKIKYDSQRKSNILIIDYVDNSVLSDISDLGTEYEIYTRTTSDRFYKWIEISDNLMISLIDTCLKNKILTPKFINELSTYQRFRMFDKIKNIRSNLNVIEGIQILGIMCGIRSSISLTNNKFYLNVISDDSNIVEFSKIDLYGGKNIGNINSSEVTEIIPNKGTYFYEGQVWCPETDYGTFVCRRNGAVYITGNTYRDEMESRAIEQLSAVGLLFNEAKSDNPFAYYTVCCTTAFTSILNQEKKNQKLRDDMIELAGATPSMTRQIENEFEQRMIEYYRSKGIEPPKPINTPKVGFGKNIKKTIVKKEEE